MEELWKDIVSYEGLYQVSNFGHVRRLAHTVSIGRGNYRHLKKKVEKLHCDNSGYLYVGLLKNNKNKRLRVHRLVAKAFIENKDNLPCINHKDGNKQNNRVDNLEWCTYSHNNQHAYDNGLKTWKRPVVRLKQGIVIKRYESITDAEKDGFKSSLICHCCNNKRKTHGGYEWHYI